MDLLKPSGFLIIVGLALSGTTRAGELTIGSIGHSPSEEIQTFKPLADTLATQLKADGIDQVSIVVTPDIPTMVKHFKEGTVDLYIDSPYPATIVSKLADTRFLLRRWKKRMATYRSVIFARRDRRINRLEDLKGRLIAFEEDFSTTGYFVPRSKLSQIGLRLVEVKSLADPIDPERVYYRFSKEDDNTMVWVLRGMVDAGAMDDGSFEKLATGRAGELKILYKSDPFPRHIVSYRPTLPPALVARLREVLIKMDQSEEGRKALQKFQKTTKFDEFPEGAERMRERLLRWLEQMGDEENRRGP